MRKKPMKPNKKTPENAANIYPGADNDTSRCTKPTKKEVKQDVKELNNNPRNTDIDMP